MDSKVTADLYLRLWVLVQQTRDAMIRAREKELQPYGISTTQAAVLSIVHAIGDKATPAEVSRWLLREPRSVSDILGRMVKRRLIRESKDLDRKNLIRITLTDKGEEAYQKSLARESVHRIISALPKKECQKLASLLKVLRDSALREADVKHNVPLP